jgi:hypothetical protein
MTRPINSIVIHCSDSTWGNAVEIATWHRARGWDTVGYHFIIGNGYVASNSGYNPVLDGQIESGRDVKRQGAHVKGFNKSSIGICLIGKLSFTKEQLRSMKKLVNYLIDRYPGITNVYAHNEKDKNKTCPNMSGTVLRDFIATDNSSEDIILNLLDAVV